MYMHCFLECGLRSCFGRGGRAEATRMSGLVAALGEVLLLVHLSGDEPAGEAGIQRRCSWKSRTLSVSINFPSVALMETACLELTTERDTCLGGLAPRLSFETEFALLLLPSYSSTSLTSAGQVQQQEV